MTDSSGLRAVQEAFARGGFGRGIGTTLGLWGVNAETGRVTLAGRPTEDHYNPLGSVHGGYIATLLDGAMALAVQTLVEPGTPYATTDLNISYLRPLSRDAGEVTGVGHVIERTRTRALASAELRDRAGRLYAHATAGFAVTAAPPPRSAAAPDPAV